MTRGLLAAAGVLVAALLLGSRDRDDESRCRMLIPAYVPPEAVAGLARAELLVVNPASGPGSARDDAYRTAVRASQRAGARVLGYVATGYGARPRAQVEADIERYARWYGTDGVFLDEAAAGADLLDHYRALAAHARGLVVLNPGTVPDRAYFDLADVVVVFEGEYARYVETRFPEWLPRARSAVLVHGATRDQAGALAQEEFGYVYATPGTLPNPWAQHRWMDNGPLTRCGATVKHTSIEVGT